METLPHVFEVEILMRGYASESLLPFFKPRPLEQIVATLQEPDPLLVSEGGMTE
jgi:hypothetical protein